MKIFCKVEHRKQGFFRRSRPTINPLFFETTEGWKQVEDTLTALNEYQGSLPGTEYVLIDLNQSKAFALEEGLKMMLEEMHTKKREQQALDIQLRNWNDSLAVQSADISARSLQIATFQDTYLPLKN
jgi:hypothetical protein